MQISQSCPGARLRSSRCRRAVATQAATINASVALRRPENFLGRQIQLKPWENLAYINTALTSIDVEASQYDGRVAMPALTALTSAAATLGCHLVQTFVYSLDASLLSLAAIASAPLAIWHLRCWWVQHMALCKAATGQGSSSSSSSSSNASSQASFASWQPTLSGIIRILSLIQASGWAAYSTASGSPLALGAAAAWFAVSVASFPFIASQLGAAIAPAVSGLTQAVRQAVAKSLPGLAGDPTNGQPAAADADTAAAPPSAQGTPAPAAAVPVPLLGCILAADAAFVGLMAGLPLAVRAGLGVVLGLSLFTGMQQPSVARRFDVLRAAAGDEVEVHVTVTLENGVPIDSTKGRGPPIKFTVGKAEEQLLGTADSKECNGGGQHEGSPAQIAANPLMARFLRLAPVLDDAVSGTLTGQEVEVLVDNVPIEEGGFANPDLLWWQPTDDVKGKFKRLPSPGQVFWFPLGSASGSHARSGAGITSSKQDHQHNQGLYHVPVQVTAVNERFVEMNGNYALENAPMRVFVELVSLQKRS